MATRVLLVDDDPVIRVLLQDYLTALQYQVQVAESGIQCLEMLAKGTPDILLLDFQMPVMNGLEVLKSIRGDPALQKLSVIMLSANRDTEKYITAAELTADRYIIKPFEMREITEAIQSMCGAQTAG